MAIWTVETLDGRVDRELARLLRDLVACFLRISELLEAHGPDTVGMPHVRRLSGADKLWEMRMSGKDGIARAIYVTARHQRIVVVCVFEKKTRKTPKATLETARKRAKEME